jgi:hypothetical protein
VFYTREYPLDVDADARRFYSMTLDEMYGTLDGPTFYGLVERLSAYDGVITKRIGQLNPGQTKDERKEVDLDEMPSDLFSRTTV